MFSSMPSLDKASMKNVLAAEKNNRKLTYQVIGATLLAVALLVSAIAVCVFAVNVALTIAVPLATYVASKGYVISAALLYFGTLLPIAFTIFHLFSRCVLGVGSSASSPYTLNLIKKLDAFGNSKIDSFVKAFGESEKIHIPTYDAPLTKEDILKLYKSSSSLKRKWLQKLDIKQIYFLKENLNPSEFNDFVSKGGKSAAFLAWQKVINFNSLSDNEKAIFFQKFEDEPELEWLLRRAVGEYSGGSEENFYVNGFSPFKLDRNELNGFHGVSEESKELFFSLCKGEKKSIQLNEKRANELFLLAEHYDIASLKYLFYTYPFFERDFLKLSPTVNGDILRNICYDNDYSKFMLWRCDILQKSITIDNILEVLNEADIYKFRAVAEKCGKYALNNYKNFLFTKDFDQLHFDMKEVHNTSDLLEEAKQFFGLLYVFNMYRSEAKSLRDEMGYILNSYKTLLSDPLNLVFVCQQIGKKWGMGSQNFYVPSFPVEVSQGAPFNFKLEGLGEFKVNINALMIRSNAFKDMSLDYGQERLNEVEIPSELPVSKESAKIFFELIENKNLLISLDEKKANELLHLSDFFQVEDLKDLFLNACYAFKRSRQKPSENYIRYVHFQEGEFPNDARKEELDSLINFLHEDLFFNNSKIVGDERDRLVKYFDAREKGLN